MSGVYVSKTLRRKVATQAHHRCGYCLSAEELTGIPCDVDHIIPMSVGGQTIEENLWLVCSPCNQRKSDRTSASDPLTRRIVRLFNPRTDDWADHFVWAADGLLMMGTTAVGRATVAALQLNREMLVNARRRWIQGGWHPPKN